MIHHPHFSITSIENNLMLIKVNRFIQLNNFVRLAGLPNGPAPEGTMCTVSTWAYNLCDVCEWRQDHILFSALDMLLLLLCSWLLQFSPVISCSLFIPSFHLIFLSLSLAEEVLQAFTPHCILLPSLLLSMTEVVEVKRGHLYSSLNFLHDRRSHYLGPSIFLASKCGTNCIRYFQTIPGKKKM